MHLETVQVEKPAEMNFVLGQAHFIKTVEDIQEMIVNTHGSIGYGVAFAEASGPCLIRSAGSDSTLEQLAVKNMQKIACGHTFILFLTNGYPLNILGSLKMLPEVCQIFCATANDAHIIVAETQAGRGILGVIDGQPPKGVETESDKVKRRDFLRQIGYKF